MPTGREYANEAYKILNIKPAAGYIWGTCNRLWSNADQLALERKYHSNPTKYSDLELGALYGKKWIGHIVFDCSGLTKYCGSQIGLNYHHGSNSSYLYDCVHKGEKKPNTRLPIGAWVYTGNKSNRGHIGIVFDDTWVIEAQGTKAGVVKSRLDLKKWTWWGLGKGMSFDFVPETANFTPVSDNASSGIGTAVSKTSDAYPTIRRDSRGSAVTKLQNLLVKYGYDLATDGIFGPKTENAVKSFQQRFGLVVDGIVGPKTWKKLIA